MQTVICSRFVAVILSSNQFSCGLPVYQYSWVHLIFLGSHSLPFLLGSPDKFQFHTHFNDMQTGNCSRFVAVVPSSNHFSWVPRFSLVPQLTSRLRFPDIPITCTCTVICSHSVAVCQPMGLFNYILKSVSSLCIRYGFRIPLFLPVAVCSPPFLTT